MWRDFLILNSRSVVIHGKRVPASSLRSCHGLGNPVIVLVGNLKYYRSIEDWLNHDFATAPIRVPQFELTAVLMLLGFI